MAGLVLLLLSTNLPTAYYGLSKPDVSYTPVTAVMLLMGIVLLSASLLVFFYGL